MGWFVSYDEKFILIAEESKVDDLTRKLMRIGLDNIYGYVEDVKEWQRAGGNLTQSNVLSTEEFKNILNTDAQIVDLRGETEFASGHVEGATNVFIGTLEQNLDKISKHKDVVIYCQGGDRSAIGYSLLLKHGFSNIKNYS
jgi:hydroxyacylglutathione hydrolase